jgi:hypothetical protein
MTRARSLSQLANSNVFSVDANNSRVGIGSTIPDVKLDVGGDLYADNLTINNLIGVAATFSGVVTYEDVTNVDSLGIITARSYVSIADSIVHTGDINTAIRFPAADTFTVETAGSEALRITSDGKIGIGGETSPEFKVTIYDAEYSGVTIKSNRTTATDNLGGLHFKTQSTNVAYIQSLVDGTIKFRNTSSLTERLRIDSSGNVGINTTTPTEKLSVNGNVVFGHDQPAGNPGSTIGVATVRGHHVNSDADYAELYFANSTSSGGSTASIRAGRSGDNAGTNLTFYTQQFGGSAGNGTERLRITSGGQVQIPVNASGATSGRFQIGASQQLSIFQDSANAYLANDDFIIANGAVSEVLARFRNGGAVELYHNNSKTFETTSTGVEITGTVSDSIGPLRRLGANTQSGAYTLVAGDAGKYVAQATNSASVTVPNGVFSAGDMVTIVNLTATNINITQGAGLDLNFTADGTTGTRTLGAKGACTILFVSSGTSFISGSGLS